MREETWKGQPFGSVEEVAGLIEEFIELVLEAGSQGIEPQVVAIRYPGKQYPRMPLADLRELAPALKLDGADFFVAAEPGGQPKPVGIEFNAFNSDDHRPSARLGVDGQNEVAVNGVFVAAKERVDKLFERKRHAEQLAAATEAKDAGATEPEPTWRKVVNNQWTVQIGTGVILFGLGLLIGSR
jgi:hypothetical protein